MSWKRLERRRRDPGVRRSRGGCGAVVADDHTDELETDRDHERGRRRGSARTARSSGRSETRGTRAGSDPRKLVERLARRIRNVAFRPGQCDDVADEAADDHEWPDAACRTTPPGEHPAQDVSDRRPCPEYGDHQWRAEFRANRVVRHRKHERGDARSDAQQRQRPQHDCLRVLQVPADRLLAPVCTSTSVAPFPDPSPQGRPLGDSRQTTMKGTPTRTIRHDHSSAKTGPRSPPPTPHGRPRT